MQSYDGEIRNLEDRSGMKPRVRAACGNSSSRTARPACALRAVHGVERRGGEFKRTLGDLNTSLEADIELDVEDEDNPRQLEAN